ncbi:MAG TPA: hypothetical protein VHE78_07775 [Gemmatimonadaceae bacterium]|nr:hypothetical protein [Gemmatimonadaceae bacterium]
MTVTREAFLAGLVVLAIYIALRPDAPTNLGRLIDDGVYLAVGKAIAHGEGYRSIHMVGAPVQVKFPPLLPALYALFWLGTDSLMTVTRLALAASIAATAASAALLWYYARNVLGTQPLLTAFFVIAPLASEHTMFYFSGPISEPWMLLGWAAALLLMERLRRGRQARREPVAAAVALGLVLAATVLARSQAIAIAIGMLACLPMVRAGWRSTCAAVAATAVPLATWALVHAAMAARGPLSTQPDQ